MESRLNKQDEVGQDLLARRTGPSKCWEWEEARKWDRDTWEELAGKPRAWG